MVSVDGIGEPVGMHAPSDESETTWAADDGTRGDVMNAGKTERRVPTSPDAVLSALADEHRRAVLRSLNGAKDEALTFDVLVNRVADLVRNEVAERTTDDHRQCVRTALHHNHLPILEECQMIDYDSETKQVRTVTEGMGQDLLTVVESYEARE